MRNQKLKLQTCLFLEDGTYLKGESRTIFRKKNVSSRVQTILQSHSKMTCGYSPHRRWRQNSNH